MAFADEIAADLAELEGEFQSSFTHNAITYPCVAGSVTRGKTLGSGGYQIEADLVLFVRAELFPTPAEHAGARPESKETLAYNGVTYRIDDVVTPANEPFLKLVCTDLARKL